MFASVDEVPDDDVDDLYVDVDYPVGEPEPAIDLTLAPGARLALQIQVAGAVPELLARTEVLDTVEGIGIVQRWFAGLRIRMLAEFTDRHPADSVSAPPGADESGVVPSQRWVPTEVALTEGTSRLEALAEITQAQRFVQVLPDTLALLEQGRIDLRRATAIARATAVLPDDLARAVERRVLPKAPDATLRQLQDRIRRAIARVDPDGEYRRHREANRERRVSIRSLEDGMASLWFYGSAAEIEAAWQMADRLARSLPAADPRTLDQRRFDLAMQVLQGRLTVTDMSDVDTAVTEILARADQATGSDGSGGNAGGGTGTGTATGTATGAATGSASGAATGNATRHDTGTDDGAADGAADGAVDGAGDGSSDGYGRTSPGTPDDPGRDRDHQAGHATPAAQPDPPEDRPPPEPPPAPRIPPDVLAAAVAEALSRRPDLHATVRKPLVQVVVGLDTLLGSERPAELVGHGPIDADTARAIAADSVIRRVTSDPITGVVLEYGRTTYAPPAALADHVRSRDQICRGPVCTRRVRDLDHHQDWAHHGDTDEDNLFGYCKHCHMLKDAPGWHVVPNPDGTTLTWISPCGRRTTSAPFDYRDFTDDLPAWDGRSPTAATATAGVADAAGRGAGPTRCGTEDDDPPPF